MNTKRIDVANLNKRSKTAIWLLVFFSVFVVIALFSDPNCLLFPSWKNETGKELYPFIFSMINICFTCWINHFVAKEINNCFIKRNSKWIVCIIDALLLIYELPLTIFYQLNTYKIVSTPSCSLIFIIVLFCGLITLFLIMFLLTKQLTHSSIINCLYSSLATCIFAIFYIASFYIISTKAWTNILILFVVSCLTDVFAYIFGSLFGQHKMCVHISPKKTWEGFIAGVIIASGVIAAIISTFYIASSNINYSLFNSLVGWQWTPLNNHKQFISLLNSNIWWVIAIFLVIILSLISVFGDLLFSVFKRKNQIKDYSNFLPGHGGILDRVDSISVVVSFYFLISIIFASCYTGLNDNSTIINFIPYL